MYTKKSNKSPAPAFRVETVVYEVLENQPDKTINLATGEVRKVSDWKPNKTWQKVTLTKGNPLSQG